MANVQPRNLAIAVDYSNAAEQVLFFVKTLPSLWNRRAQLYNASET